MKLFSSQILFYFFIFMLGGCAAAGSFEQLLVLKRAGRAQSEIQKYINRQETLFYVLRDDIKNNKFKMGTIKKDIIKRYGDPVIEREIKDDSSVAQEALYRHPTRYFSSDRIYLYFSAADELVRWKYYP